jgi:hypothetical protein
VSPLPSSTSLALSVARNAAAPPFLCRRRRVRPWPSYRCWVAACMPVPCMARGSPAERAQHNSGCC